MKKAAAKNMRPCGNSGHDVAQKAVPDRQPNPMLDTDMALGETPAAARRSVIHVENFIWRAAIGRRSISFSFLSVISYFPVRYMPPTKSPMPAIFIGLISVPQKTGEIIAAQTKVVA